MKSLKKRATGAARLHAALAETDPSSPDLILVRTGGLRPAVRLPALAWPPLRAAGAGQASVGSRPQRGLSPCWRERYALPKRTAVLPV